MTNRELLELAARAAGLDDAEYEDFSHRGEVRYGFSEAIWSRKLWDEIGQGYWNPLKNDGDVLRLAVGLRLSIENNPPDDGELWVMVSDQRYHDLSLVEFEEEGQRLEMTRRAIVLAAAEIAKESA